ncbi:calcium-binding protein 1a isoform X1 [Corythoichthys intestinalis]|uniref:calcium-binding protein 1a isoform X1 n=1 Tax=Corythoichthys intestinalis TaxID=161448 RepID=UPI0025A6054E|nr:calcium-binding protein 1a isoform X1 [Corythoichthys intestinalis]XP_061804601.1 calcium-binding protein 1-like [Nerophis lumbriciformis]
MSASFPQSDSKTSLLKTSSSRSTHVHERTTESRRSHHQHHHHRPAASAAAALQSNGTAEDAYLSAGSDVSARRPLCHPTLTGSRDRGESTRVKCRPHASDSHLPDPPEPLGEAGHGVRERGAHRHHRRRKHNREERQPAAGPPEPEPPPESEHRRRYRARPLPRMPPLSDNHDDRTPLCEPRDQKRASLTKSGGRASRSPPSASSPVPLSSTSSRRSRRSSAASFASDVNLRAVLNSLFGQDRELRPEEMDELRDAFKEFDKDKDGFISCKDLGNCMRTMGYMPTEMELIELSQQINMNLGGHVDFEDFVELMGPKLLAETADMIGVKELKDAFREFDTNGDGAISTSELRDAMRKLLGHQVGLNEVEDILREVDLNGDGLVDFEEFVRMMSR